jgi:hypothetical protein
VGNQALEPSHHLRPEDSDQVVDPGRFSHGVDGDQDPATADLPRVLDHVLRWLAHGHGRGGGIVLVSPSGDRLRYTIRLHFTASNNVAEYEALIHRLRIASDLGAWCIYVRGDSELVVDHVMKDASC